LQEPNLELQVDPIDLLIVVVDELELWNDEHKINVDRSKLDPTFKFRVLASGFVSNDFPGAPETAAYISPTPGLSPHFKVYLPSDMTGLQGMLRAVNALAI
jgi:hypothetical protein